ncbi:MAG: class I SAM-dependent methyltransferase [Chlorobiaceae bacterium]|nr:class I SAM-dependent methyltransferase [Chlorobiaceae bacterium]
MTGRPSPSRDGSAREWFEDWFNHPLYLQVYSHRDDAEAARCVETILRITGLDHEPDKASVLDIACGAGRHAFAFARKGHQITANDLSAFLLGTAESEAAASGLDIAFTRCDMRAIRLERQFDLVVQLFSSFGYFETEDEDRAVLRNVLEMLRPGGWYVLDLLNPSWLSSHFVPHSEKTSGELTITEERTLSHEKVSKRIGIRDAAGHTISFTESMKLFSPEAISGLLQSEGFEVVRIAGDYLGAEFLAPASPRILLFSRKPS